MPYRRNKLPHLYDLDFAMTLIDLNQDADRSDVSGTRLVEKQLCGLWYYEGWEETALCSSTETIQRVYFESMCL